MSTPKNAAANARPKRAASTSRATMVDGCVRSVNSILPFPRAQYGAAASIRGVSSWAGLDRRGRRRGLDVSVATIERVRRRVVQIGADSFGFETGTDLPAIRSGPHPIGTEPARIGAVTHSHEHLAEPQDGRLGAFESRDFRLYWTATLLQQSSNWMQNVAVAWLLLEMTNSPALLGLNWLFQSVPFIASSMIAGAVADRMNRRRLLLITQTGLCLISLTQALLVFFGLIQVWQVYLLSALSLTCAGFESAARQSFIPSLVPRKHLASAIALHTSLHRSTAVIGPVLGGIAIASWEWPERCSGTHSATPCSLARCCGRAPRLPPHRDGARCGARWWTDSCTCGRGRCCGAC